MPPHGGDDAAPVKSGELVRLDFELWAEGVGKSELIDTTREEVAQTAKAQAPEGIVWGPRAHLIGGEYFPGGIENALAGLKVGENLEKEFPPAEAFGERDPKLIELFSMHEISRLPEMRRDDAELDVGTILTIRGRRGRVVSYTAARVRVDFNPPFAGRKVRGRFHVVERIQDPADQARALVDLTYGHGKDFDVKVHQGVVTLKVPDRAKFDFSWMASKPRVIDRIRSQLKPTSIHVLEEYVTPAKEKEPAAKPDEAKGEGAASAPPSKAEAPAEASHPRHAHTAKPGTETASD